MKHFALAALVGVTSCAPMITHGPLVQPGVSGGVSAALGKGPPVGRDGPGPFYAGALLANVAYGFQPANGGIPALRVGVQGLTTEEGTGAVDIYAQLPRKWIWPVVAGVGLLKEFPANKFPEERSMPYVQAGIRNAEGFAVDLAVGRYARQGDRLSGLVSDRIQVNWLSLEIPLPKWVSIHYHAGYASGYVRSRRTMGQPEYTEKRHRVTLGGATVEIHR